MYLLEKVIGGFRKLRNSIKEERLNDLVDGIRSADTRKGNVVSSMQDSNGSDAGSNYISPSQGISMFDDGKDFERIPEKTEGEKISEAKKEVKEDNSWRETKGTFSTSKLLDNMLDNLFDE